NASTADLRRVMEEASKQELGWFFDQWLKRPTSPSFDGGWRYNPDKKQIEVEITQTQPGDAYRVPIEIGSTVAGQLPTAPKVDRFEMKEKHATFAIASDQAPATVTFDPNTWLLMDQVNFVKRP